LNATEVARFLGYARKDKVGVSEEMTPPCHPEPSRKRRVEGSHGDSDDSVCGVLRFRIRYTQDDSGGKALRMTNKKITVHRLATTDGYFFNRSEG
jgi:hypothetical protein